MINNEITYNVFKGGKVGAANEVGVECDHDCNKMKHSLLLLCECAAKSWINWNRIPKQQQQQQIHPPDT